MDIKDHLLNLFPKELTYRFIDDVIDCSDSHVVGIYTFPKDAEYYKGHFPGFPVTPGSVLMEAAVQLGTVVLGKYLMYLAGKDITKHHVILISSELKFNKPVFPGDTIRVRSERRSFNFDSGLIRSVVRMTNKDDQLICKGKFTCKIVTNEQLAK